MDIKLLKAHTHAGKRYRAGDWLTVTPFDGNWLIESGVALPRKAGEKVPTVTAHTTRRVKRQ